MAGIRLPDIAVPLATYTGWNEYKPPYPEGELADRDGSYLAFPADKAARARAIRGLDRPALCQPRRLRRQGPGGRRGALLKDRLLLPEDADRYLERARGEPRVAP